MTHDPHQLRVRALGDLGRERVLVGWGVQANLDQLVVAERGKHRPHDALRDARVPDLNERLQGIRLAAQEAALKAGQAAARLVHGAHSKGGLAPSRARALALALGLCFGVACATTAPPAPASFEPMPRVTALPEAHPPVALHAEGKTEATPLLDPAPPENSSLLYSRAVLAKHATKLDDVQREGVARALVLAEADHGLPVLMTLALITQESRFDPRAKGPTGSLGLMQLQPVTARDVARRHELAWQSDRTLFDPVQNVRLGLAYLAELRERFGSTDHAMAAYNIGPGNLVKLLKKRPLRHGPYLKKVHAHATSMQGEFGTPETAIGG